MKTRRVVGLGLCVVDHLYRVEGLEWSGSRLRFGERMVSTGGMIGNALVQVAALDCDAQLVTGLGDDPEGRWLTCAMARHGVKTDHVVCSDQLSTTVAVVLVDVCSGERRFIVPDRKAMERSAPRFDLAAIERGTVLLVDGHFPEQALRAVRRAREVGATVVGDFHAPRPAVRKLLPYVDYPIVPVEFAEAYAGPNPNRTLETLHERFGGSPIVTRGAEGGSYLLDGRIGHYRAARAQVQDTTGAGDAFHGAFAAALHHGMEFGPAIRLAAKAAAVCCTALGATTALLGREALPARTERR
ncbi:MAG: carbohydrate kinase family protein [Myxococcota bacterium]